jgi:cation diffusion facilitator CzcD-associated flavoprotein CzcO
MSATRTARSRSSMAWEAFAGPVLHEVTDADLERLAGRRVALVGDPTAVASAVSKLARQAATLKVFQTDGVWVLPDLGPLSAIVSLVPAPLRRRLTEPAALLHLRRQVPDGWVRRHLTPSSPVTRATLLTSSSYYRALRRTNVELVVWPLASIVPAGIRTADGIEHHVDVIVRLT